MTRKGVCAVLRAALAILAFVALSGCGLLDYLPRQSPGRPASEVRRTRPDAAAPQRQQEQREAVIQPAPQGRASEAEADSAFRPRRAVEAQAQARRLEPASQSLSGFTGLAEPLRHSLTFLAKKPQAAPALVQPGGSLTWGQLSATAQELFDILPDLDADPGLLAERFVWYELASSPLVTGYYSPEVEASLTRQPGFEQPLYGQPPDLRKATPEEQRQGRPKAYRASGGAILPYHDRQAIDLDGVLAGQGLEIAWVRSPMDAFVLQTEGAGTLVLPDGRRRTVQFKASNGFEFQGLGQLLLANEALPKERLSRASIRSWCLENAERAQQIMAQNRSYVFFELRDGAAVGAMEKPLTALVSLATDPSLLPLGAVAVLDLGLPGQNGGSPAGFHGLVLAQDTGSDIRGHRLDLYLGGGEGAERLEAGLRASAGLHLLVSKNALRSKAYTRGQ
jgi:membrane-bound lytic murein transglycosylase A